MSASEIRLARQGDERTLVALLLAQLREHTIVPAARDLAHTVAMLLGQPERTQFLLAVCDGVPVGVAAVSYTWPIELGGRGAWLEELYVVPPARGGGIGERLLEAAIALARGSGARAIDLEVERGHERAESLYVRHGFRALERRHWTKPLDGSEG
jgi:GNAT superfamily N-acetyltransferase